MKKLRRIGLAVNRSYAYYRGMLRGIGRYAETKPDWLFTSVVPEEQSILALGRFRLAGLIASVSSEQLVRALSSLRQPVVNVSHVLPGLRFRHVGVDNDLVGRQAAAHLLERGLRHFGFVGSPDLQYSVERHAAFRQALAEAGHTLACYHSPAHLPFDPLCRRWDVDEDVYRWLRKLPKPVGIFATSDEWGVQVGEACRHVGLRVPEDVALLGVNDDDLDCELSRPRMSSVIVPAERVGFEAAALLDRLLSGEKPAAEPVLIPPTGVATRRSTEILAIEDEEVVAAVRFIRENAHLPLRVADVLKEIPVGRRTLERRCYAALGWGLGDEIRRAHLALAQRLLARTELSMKSVAQQAGFSDFRHMAVVFRQHEGIAPTAYRRKVRGEPEVPRRLSAKRSKK
jgi:LacI family transcriptional regulator, galactose operon repressor